MGILAVVIVSLLVGFGLGIGLIYLLNDAGACDFIVSKARENTRLLRSNLKLQLSERRILRHRVKAVKRSIRKLKDSVTGLVDELEVLEGVWEAYDVSIDSTKYVDAKNVAVFGRGDEWVYLYTFPTHENLADAKGSLRYPMKLGMTTRPDVVGRISEQVRSSTTAMSERAILRLAFRVNDAEGIEQWMHDKLGSAGNKLKDSIGKEWFNTNPLEIERLFRSYVLQHSTQDDPVIFGESEVEYDKLADLI